MRLGVELGYVETIEKQETEIARLRAELAEAQDEVLALRSRELYVTAERDRLRAELANKATTAVLERVAAAQSADPGTDDLTVCLALEVADLEAVNSELRAAARRDAEGIARLREALEPFAVYADVKGGTPQTEALRQVIYAICETPYPEHLTAIHEFCVACRKARAALAPRPPEGKGDT